MLACIKVNKIKSFRAMETTYTLPYNIYTCIFN